MRHGEDNGGEAGFGRDAFAFSGRVNVAPEERGKAASQRQELITNRQWETVYNQPCRVTSFTPFARVDDGRVISTDMTTPYALVRMECPDCASGLLGAIGHKIDFKHLWEAFAERGDHNDVEVIIFWVKKPQNWFSRMIAPFMPGLGVMLCKAGAYELISDRHSRPKLAGKARFQAEAPILHWHPNAVGFRQGPYFVEDMKRLWASREAESGRMAKEQTAIRRAYEASEGEEIPEDIKRLLDKLT